MVVVVTWDEQRESEEKRKWWSLCLREKVRTKNKRGLELKNRKCCG